MKKTLSLSATLFAIALTAAGLTSTAQAACIFGPVSAYTASPWPTTVTSTVGNYGQSYTFQNWVQNTDGGFRWLWSGVRRIDNSCNSSKIHGANYTSEVNYSTGLSTTVTTPLTSTQCGTIYWHGAPANGAINGTQVQIWSC